MMSNGEAVGETTTRSKLRGLQDSQNGKWNPPLTVSPNSPPVPRGWRWRLLREIAKLESGHTPSRYRPDWWGGDIPWLALPDIRELDGKLACETGEYTNEAGIANSSARLLPAGTVCLSRTASVGFVTKLGRPMATSQDFVNWGCGPELDPDFLLHLLIASRDYIRAQSSGAIHKTVYVPTVKEFRICCPPLAEQKRIAGILNQQLAAVARARAAAQAQLEAAKALNSAYLRDVFDGDKAINWASHRLSDVMDRWNVIIHPGGCEGGHTSFVGLEHIESNTGRRIGAVPIDLGNLTGRKPTFKKGQIVYGYLRPYLNKVWIAEFDGCSSVDQFAFNVREDRADARFIAAFMRSDTFLSRSAVVTTTGQLPRISIDEILSVKVDLPTAVQDQTRIADEIAARSQGTELLIERCKAQLTDLDAMPAALLRSAFQGSL